MAKRMSDKKRQSRRRSLKGGADTDVAPDASAIDAAAPDAAAADAPVDTAAPAATEGSFMGTLFSTESTPAVDAAAATAVTAATVTEKPTDSVVMSKAYKSKKITKSKAKKGKKCKTAKGNCKKWFKLNKNKLCASTA